MSRYDLCLSWNWEYDADFVHLIEAACAARGVSLLQATPASLDQVLAGLEDLAASLRGARFTTDDGRSVGVDG